MRIIFEYLLKKYSRTKEDRVKIHKILHSSLDLEYSNKTFQVNICEYFNEMLLGSEYFQDAVKQQDKDIIYQMRENISFELHKTYDILNRTFKNNSNVIVEKSKLIKYIEKIFKVELIKKKIIVRL